MKPILQNRFTLSLLIILLIILLHYISLLSPFEKLITVILSPFQSATYSVAGSISNKFNQITARKNLSQDNFNLRQKIDKLEQQIVELKMFIEENQMVSQQAKYLQSQGFKFVDAKVISRSVDGNPRLLVINRGRSDGIKKGMAGVVNEGRVIGKVINVSAKQSSLLLLIDNQCQMSASLAGQSQIIGLAGGEHNISVTLKNILKTSIIKKGDLIITSGKDEHIPPGLLIGEVGEVIDNKTELFKNASLITQANFKNLRIVSIVLF